MTSGSHSSTDGSQSGSHRGAEGEASDGHSDPIEMEETTDAPPVHTLSGSDQLDELLEACLEQFLVVAPAESPAVLRDFLPDADAQTKLYLLIELIKMDMATAVETDPSSAKRIENYLPHFADLISSETVPMDLLMEEIQLRRECGEVLQADEFLERFPQHENVIAELFGEPANAKLEATAAVHNRKRPPDLEIGEQVDDFVVVQTLGSGAFANVYLARQVSMSRLVALKVSRGTGDEPQALAQLDHLNIVRVYDQRGTESPPMHLLYMQFQPGGTLGDVVKVVDLMPVGERSGDILLASVDRALLKTAQVVPERSAIREWLATAPWPMTVAWVGIQLAAALDSAHGRGVMHRDVKPANVLLSAEGIPKLADFNVSYAGSAGRAGAAQSFGGSIGYMSPEHLRAISATALSEVEEVGPKADLYSLAILLWELWQGKRPFDPAEKPKNWSQAIEQQLEARAKPIPSSGQSDDALSRLLETTLRETLCENPDDRIGTGVELAARLKLALHADAAIAFDPEPSSWQGWLSWFNSWWVAAVVILIPNALAGVYAYFYNFEDTLGQLFEEVDGLQATFERLSASINAIAFPLAVVLVLYFTRQVVDGLKRAAKGQAASEADLQASLELAHRAAVIGGFLWCSAAVIYPTVLWNLYPEFTRREFSHFFLSHVICGGVAAIYPFFGMTVYATTVLYPKMVRPTLNDQRFDARFSRLIRRCERYFWLACTVPLLAAALLLLSDASKAKDVMLIAIAATMIGLLASFSAYRLIVSQVAVLSKMLSTKKETVIPS